MPAVSKRDPQRVPIPPRRTRPGKAVPRPRADPFEDAALYDWEYRRRRDDVRFYATLAGERGGPILDLGCGTGRLMLPLLRAGHVVVGVDRAPAMLARAAARLRRLPPRVRRRALLLRADLRRLPVARRFAFVVAAKGTEESQEYEPGGHGLFTYALLESLKPPADSNGDGVVSLTEAFEHLAPIVEKLRVRKLRQTPQLIAPRALEAQPLAKVSR